MYITGGIGSSGSNEGFGIDYDLPNEQAYCETCASVGMVFWNQRMNALTGDAKYMDVLERSLYNGALDGLSLSGDRFFYGNPLGSNGKNARREWFGTACCPANIARLIASIGDYIYAKDEESIYINLFVGSETKVNLKGKDISIKMETNYPLDGNIQIAVSPATTSNFRVLLRKPGWSNNTVVPGNLYSFIEGAYNDGKAYNILLPTESKIVELPMNILQEQIVALSTTVPSIQIAADGKSLQTIDKKILAIPYYTWCNRGSNQMQVWIPTSIKDIKLNN